ncbi:tRNA (N6-threonylcarbamoyladenosine(37)-N6)-methyltransferase TrmO [Fusibacter tunisiensis]|uniref:tRNA-Thr(GGU) m(6)t(6)A37 methyltransferase TsaA n=1 Tax=Fusibacter tunisiensis TaxID=1008308 RepID=A0ABS2MSP8_9FIRM|nr:tRNA (N6-threonylcarbamoyladenosine(37)-N6)-methyltransferase TrmO [Fusibacter tunisiensis]MBM7562449.1 tRNA-Thr(GGU) m(6)t(6)A37 methyltransferase TsaA [Fusibacter tunisiensis]
MKYEIDPIGYVESDYKITKDIPVLGVTSTICIKPEFEPALKHIEKNSHLWVLSWLHESDRTHLQSVPRKISSMTESFGVFALRSPNRPNPVALTLVKLLKIEGNRLTVSDLDVIHGTPIVDIKPYFDKDSVFAPETLFINSKNDVIRRKRMETLAENYHGEKCDMLQTAVDMAMKVSNHVPNLQARDLRLEITGNYCLLESLQGITRAKFVAPSRLTFKYSTEKTEVLWFHKDILLAETSYTDVGGVVIT